MGIFGDSKEYKAVYQSLKALQDLEKEGVSAAGAAAIGETLRGFQKACEKYLSTRSGARTDRGKERYQQIQQLYEKYLRNEHLIKLPEAVRDNREYDGMNWEKAWELEHARQVMDESRAVLRKMEDQPVSLETAPKVVKAHHDMIEASRVYFTAQAPNDSVRAKQQEARREHDAFQARNLDALRDVRRLKEFEGKTWKQVDQVKRPFVQVGKKVEKAGAGASIRYKVTYNNTEGFFTEGKKTTAKLGDVFDRYVEKLPDGFLRAKMEKYKGLLTNSLLEEKALSRENTIGECMEQIREQMKELPEKERTELARDGRFLRAGAELMVEIWKEDVMLSGSRLETGTDFSRLNEATTRLADLLGVGGLIAHSQEMEIEMDGKRIRGNFMEKAPGEDINSKDPEVLMKFAQVEKLQNPGLNKDLSNLRVLDYLCYQKDRHSGNVLYRLGEPGPDGHRQILGIMGIDNDLAFSPYTERDQIQNRGTISELEDMNFISADMADRITGLDREKLEYAVGDILGGKEMDALITRVEDMKRHVRTQMIRVKDGQWELNLFSMNDTNLEKKGPEAVKYAKAAKSLQNEMEGRPAHPSTVSLIKKTLDNTKYGFKKEKEMYLARMNGLESMFENAEKEAEKMNLGGLMKEENGQKRPLAVRTSQPQTARRESQVQRKAGGRAMG